MDNSTRPRRHVSTRHQAPLSTKDFEDLVLRECQGDVTSSEVDYLRHPENLDRWIQALTNLIRKVDQQFISADEETHERQDKLRAQGLSVTEIEVELAGFYEQQSRWRRKARTFRAALVQHRDDAKLLREQRGGPGDSDADVLARHYLAAIRRHKATFPGDEDPSEEDLALWRVIEIPVEEIRRALDETPVEAAAG